MRDKNTLVLQAFCVKHVATNFVARRNKTFPRAAGDCERAVFGVPFQCPLKPVRDWFSREMIVPKGTLKSPKGQSLSKGAGGRNQGAVISVQCSFSTDHWLRTTDDRQPTTVPHITLLAICVVSSSSLSHRSASDLRMRRSALLR
jgi:hypothetical protein